MPEPKGDFGAVMDRTMRDASHGAEAEPVSSGSVAEARAREEASRSSEGVDRRNPAEAGKAAARDSDAKGSESKGDKVSSSSADEKPGKKAAADKAKLASAQPSKAQSEAAAKRPAGEKGTKVAKGSPEVTGPDGPPHATVASKVEKTKGAKVGADAAAILAHEKALAAAKAGVATEAGAQPKVALEEAKKEHAAGAKEKQPEKGDAAAAAALLATQLLKGAPSGAESAEAVKKEAAEPASKRSDGISAGQGASKTTTQPLLTVIDLRGAAHHDAVPQPSDSGPQQGGSEPKHQNFEVRLVGIDAGSRGTSDSFSRTDSLVLPSRQDAVNTLQQNWGPLMNQVVKSAGIVMRDNDSGEIRLVLKPEHLGSVRIQLEMKDNLISGKIVVENQNVRQIFQQNIESLYRAFQEGGFATGALNVSVGGNGAGTREKGRYSGLPVAEAVSGLKSLADHIPDLQTIGMGESLVNLFV